MSTTTSHPDQRRYCDREYHGNGSGAEADRYCQDYHWVNLPAAVTSPADRWVAARVELAQAVAAGATGGRLMTLRTAEFEAWYSAAEVALRQEDPGAVLKDYPDSDWEFCHADGAGLTPQEAAAWVTTGT